tara:strand:- start:1397 stop:1855 length:459 start_codon:yes stop_codon:yes gene_type:complete
VPIAQLRGVQKHFYIARLVVVIVFLFHGGCKTVSDEKSTDTEPSSQGATSRKIPIGSIHMVDPDGKFVLIQSSRHFAIESGVGIASVSESGLETAFLKVSEARKGQFLTADIVSGAPQVGDRAIMDYMPQRTQSGLDIDGAGGNDDEIQVLE